MKAPEQKHNRRITIKLTETEFQLLTKIRSKYSKSVSSVFRESLMFYANQYK
jgi:hypothetical protein